MSERSSATGVLERLHGGLDTFCRRCVDGMPSNNADNIPDENGGSGWFNRYLATMAYEIGIAIPLGVALVSREIVILLEDLAPNKKDSSNK